MMDAQIVRRVYGLFADMLEYPFAGHHTSPPHPLDSRLRGNDSGGGNPGPQNDRRARNVLPAQGAAETRTEGHLVQRVGECLELVSGTSREAASRLRAFRDFVVETPASRLEEVYTGTFDLQVVCYPYVGYQLFGESYKRGAFMAGLRQEYRASGYSEGNELPDHLAVMLRFLAVLEDGKLSHELATTCLIPALDKMSQAFKEKDQPYGYVVAALSILLRELYPGAGGLANG